MKNMSKKRVGSKCARCLHRVLYIAVSYLLECALMYAYVRLLQNYIIQITIRERTVRLLDITQYTHIGHRPLRGGFLSHSSR